MKFDRVLVLKKKKEKEKSNRTFESFMRLIVHSMMQSFYHTLYSLLSVSLSLY